MNKQTRLDIAAGARDFIKNRKSVILGTVSDSNQPMASYSPFYRNENGDIFILVSELAAHTNNLANGKANALFIADENESNQIYVRERISFECSVTPIHRDSEEYQLHIESLKHKHGNIIETLDSLADFILFKLTPESGRYVLGFGQAYHVDGALMHVRPVEV